MTEPSKSFSNTRTPSMASKILGRWEWDKGELGEKRLSASSGGFVAGSVSDYRAIILRQV